LVNQAKADVEKEFGMNANVKGEEEEAKTKRKEKKDESVMPQQIRGITKKRKKKKKKIDKRWGKPIGGEVERGASRVGTRITIREKRR